jgi:hypothetical protein
VGREHWETLGALRRTVGPVLCDRFGFASSAVMVELVV